MADAEIEIIIRAVDETSATMKRIEGTVEQTNKNILKQTKETSKGFQEQTGNLLVLGQATASVDRIMDSYTNLQLRLENASERVANAQDRLTDAQYELNKLMKSGTASAEDLQQAQRKVESANRGLTISQNNLAKANNAVFGTFVNMAIQGVTLIASFGKIKVAIMAMTKASLAFLATPLGIALAAIAVVVGVAMYTWNQYKKQQEDVVVATEKLQEANDNLIIAQENVTIAVKEAETANEDLVNAEKNLIRAHQDETKAEKDLSGVRKELLDLQKKLTDETDNWTEALKDADAFMSGVVKAKSKEENQLLLQIEQQRHNVNLAKVGGDETEIKSEEDKLSALELQHQIQYEDIRKLAEAELNLIETNAQDKYGIEKEAFQLTEQLYKEGYTNIGTFMESIFYPKLEEMWKESNKKELEAYKAKITEMHDAQQKVLDAQDKVKEAEKEVIKTKEASTKAQENIKKSEEEVVKAKVAIKPAEENLATATKTAEQGFMGTTLGQVISIPIMLIDKAIKGIGKLFGFKEGGYVPETGPYTLHKGEYVVPTSDMNKSQGDTGLTIYITGNNYGTDPDEIAEALASKIGNSIRL